MVSNLLVQFYRIWHGRFHLKGAGFLLDRIARYLPGLQAYPLRLDRNAQVTIDFRDVSSWFWINFVLGEGFEEEGLIDAMAPWLDAKSIFWDIGANAGLLSYKIACRMPHPGEIHLFEPNPQVYAIASSALKSFPFARTHQVGLSNANSTLRMTIPRGSSSCGTVMPDKTNRQGEEIDIPCVTGDNLVFKDHYIPPNVIKIDTEGHEAEVLAGLSEIIEAFKPCIFFEHISMSDVDVLKAVPVGYILYSIDDANGSLREGFDRQRGHNSALLPEGSAIPAAKAPAL
jgi:FkbM family methyltransferase